MQEAFQLLEKCLHNGKKSSWTICGMSALMNFTGGTKMRSEWQKQSC